MTFFTRTLNFRQRLTLLLLVASLPGMAVAVALAVNALAAQTAQIESGAARLAALHAAQHTTVVEGARIMLAALVGGGALAEAEHVHCGAFLRNWIDDYPSFTSLTLLDAEGGVVCSSAESELPFDTAGRPWFERVRAEGAFTVGEYTIGRTGVPLIVAAQPVFEDGRFTGAVAVGIDLRWLEFLARRAELPPGGTVTALDADGAVLVHHTASAAGPDGSGPSPLQPPPPEELRRRLTALESGVIRGLDAAAEPRVYGIHRTEAGGLVIAVGLPPYASFAQYGAALRDTLTAPLIILVLALAAAWWGAEMLITRWVRSLSRAARRMAAGNLSARSKVPHSAYEIGELAAAFDGMAEATERDRERLRAALSQRETLLRELNHRIKNAFALVQAVAVRTLRHSPTVEAFERAFLGRLDALARTSTLLATADGGEIVELRALAEATLEPHRTGDVDLRLHGPELTVPAPIAQTLSLALHELATNAAKYGALSVPEGRVELAWWIEAAPEGRRLVLEWTERGGPEVSAPPGRSGFGRALIERSVPYELGGTARLDFAPEGVRCRIGVPLEP